MVGQCVYRDCIQFVYAVKLCKKHWEKVRGASKWAYLDRCEVEWCTQEAAFAKGRVAGYCERHGIQMRNHGEIRIGPLDRDQYGRKHCCRCGFWRPDEAFGHDEQRGDKMTVSCADCNTNYESDRRRNGWSR